MRKLFGVFVLAVMLVGGTVFNAAAIPISGGISFSGGSFIADNNDLSVATLFQSFGASTLVTGGTGNYSGAVGASVTFTPFTFDPFTAVTPLWTFSTLPGPIVFSFNATSGSISYQNPNVLVLEGSGIAQISGFEDTYGTWVLTANDDGSIVSTTGSFSASTSVPEPASILLVGFGLVGLAGIGRKLKK